ncbi:hypothetical protein [Albidovulum sp.]|uniref:hypothetical protein n=1 Tax=Albidovulum sp. TaxID=1872424 RepID=UPI0039B9BD8A
MSEFAGIRSERTIFDLALTFTIDLDSARALLDAAPGCAVDDDGMVMLPRLYDRQELRRWIEATMIGGTTMVRDVFAYLGCEVERPPVEF